jgi:hypothetical protein
MQRCRESEGGAHTRKHPFPHKPVCIMFSKGEQKDCISSVSPPLFYYETIMRSLMHNVVYLAFTRKYWKRKKRCLMFNL